MRILKCVILLLSQQVLSINSSFAQAFVQDVRGKVVDSESVFPLEGVVVTVFVDTILAGGSITDDRGEFVIGSVPVGKATLKCVLLGYQERIIPNVEITSAKEIVLSISLEETAVDLELIEIRAVQEGGVSNEMALISARQFTVSETDRYAGSRGDPARMASNFAGVQGADDSRNDIVIRGNSPQGVLWRLEGIDIPNPNHFSIPGTAGGPVSIINNKYLANSDFFTGAFPADYGNSIAGVFDLRMRNGNNQHHEFSAQFGFLGTELFAEGPLSPNNDSSRGSSYLFSYRYSTVELFSLLGIDIGTSAVPRYQDAAFRFFFPLKNNASLSLWGIGGASSVDILISNQESVDERNIYGENDRDQYFKTKMATTGATFSKSLSEKSFFKTTLAAMADVQDSYHELVFRHVSPEGKFAVDSLVPLLDYTFKNNRIAWSSYIQYKATRKLTLRAGLTADLLSWNNIDSVRSIDTSATDYYQWRIRWNNRDHGYLVQPSVQVKWRPDENWTLTGGLHSVFFGIAANDSYRSQASVSPLEPRVAVRYAFSKNQSVSIAAGLHSQLQPSYMYFYLGPMTGDESCAECPREMYNRDMGLTMSKHLVGGYQVILSSNIRLLTEVYYQSLSEVPIEQFNSSFSLVNTGAGFSRFFPGKLVNKGTGRNYGVEFTAEKFFSHHWLALITASWFDSKYTGSDGVLRSTDFNGGYALNTVVSREWKTGNHSTLSTGIKITSAGGHWYGPADEVQSAEAREIIYVDSLRNTLQFAPYFRLDLKINYRINRKKTSHEIGVDLVNITGQQNILKLTYAPDDVVSTPDIREEYQLGFLPIFFYRVDF